MQAIATLHAQLNLATEKLDHAQKALTAQEKQVQDLEEDGRLRWEEVEELTEMLNNIEYDEKVGIENLDELRLQTIPLEATYKQSLGAVEVLPFAFQRLSEEFVAESKNTMNEIEDLLSLAIREKFWKFKNTMNLHHINASRLKLKKQTFNLQQSLVAKEDNLNRQLAEEESALSMVQACIEAIERKNKQLAKGGDIYEVERSNLSYSQSKYDDADSSNRTHCKGKHFDHGGGFSPVPTPPIGGLKFGNQHKTGAYKASSYNSPVTMDGNNDRNNTKNEGKCFGCQKSGHFIDKCPESYKCKTCNIHHHNSKMCTIKSINTPCNDSFTGEIQTPPSRLTDGSESHHNYGPYSNSIGRTSCSTPNTSSLTQQVQHPYQQSCQADGHISHTITHVVTEGNPSDSLRIEGENKRTNNEADDRPWFQIMKRRRSATATVGSNQNIDTVFDYSDDYGINDQYNDNYSNISKNDISVFPNAVTPQLSMSSSLNPSSLPSKSASASMACDGFRSGLEILLNGEK